MKVDRRELLYGMGAAGAISLMPGFVASASAVGPDLSVITGSDPAKNARAAVEALGGMGRFVSKGDKVVVKPNLGFGNPSSKATTTEPQVVKAIVEMALNAGAKQVLVLDNPCHKAKIVLEITGMKKELSKLDDTFVYIIKDDKFFKKVKLPASKSLKKTDIAVDILEADTIISVPVAKSHGGSKVTFSMKGWMGVVQNRKPWHVFLNLHQSIADISAFIKPKLIVLDATRALVTGGPGGPGKIAHLQTIVAGTDPVAVDAYGVTLAPWGGKGYKIEDIPHIVKAVELGVGRMDIANMNILKKTV